MNSDEKTDTKEPSELADALRKGVLLGAAILVLAIPPAANFMRRVPPLVQR